jgi:transketolase
MEILQNQFLNYQVKYLTVSSYSATNRSNVGTSNILLIRSRYNDCPVRSIFYYNLANPLNLYNDRFVLSKGHAAPLLAATGITVFEALKAADELKAKYTSASDRLLFH